MSCLASSCATFPSPLATPGVKGECVKAEFKKNAFCPPTRAEFQSVQNNYSCFSCFNSSHQFNAFSTCSCMFLSPLSSCFSSRVLCCWTVLISSTLRREELELLGSKIQRMKKTWRKGANRGVFQTSDGLLRHLLQLCGLVQDALHALTRCLIQMQGGLFDSECWNKLSGST